MKKLIISGLTIATLMTTLATSANAGWSVRTDYFGNKHISGNGSHYGQNYTCRTDYFGNVHCN